MWFKFKWDMFVTSFIPLWLSIIIFDLWDVIANTKSIFLKEGKFTDKLMLLISINAVQLISIVLITIIVTISVVGINVFLKERERSKQNSSGTIRKARKANKLSSEFLLAYILPLIAFDYSDLKSIILFLTYFTILAFLCIRNNNIYTNILLEFKKYRIYACDIECSLPGEKTEIYYDSLIISKEDLTSFENKKIQHWDCDNYIYLHIKENSENE